MSEVDPARTPPTRRRLVLVMTLVVIACFSLQIALDLASSFWRVSETSVSIAYRPPAAAFDLVAAQERAEQARQAGPVISRMGTLALAWREADTEFPDCGARFVRATLTASVTVWQTHELHGELPRIAAAAGLDAPCSGVSVRVAGIDRGASMLNGGSLLALILLVLMWRSHRGRHWLRNWLDWQPRIDRKWAVAWGVGGFVAIAAAMIAAAIVRELAGVPHEPHGMPTSQLPWMLLVGSIEAPIYEEYLFRAWALERYRRALPAWLALALSSFCFVLPHAPDNLADAGMLFGGGIVLGLLWLRTRSLPACIIAHGLYNSFQIIGRWYLLP